MAVIVVVSSSLGVVTETSPASAHTERTEFQCSDVPDRGPSTWRRCNYETFVPPNHRLCFAVRGSDGVRIWFAGMNWEYLWDTTDRAIKVGEGKQCLRTNTGSYLRLAAWARSAVTGETPDVEATAYICHPTGACP